MLELHAIAYGLVQGVFFRRTVLQHAQTFGLTGTVRNLPDDTVEIIAQGEKKTLEAFVKRLEEEPRSARLEKIETRYNPIRKTYSGFEIVYS